MFDWVVNAITWALTGIAMLLKTVIFWLFGMIFDLLAMILTPIMTGLGVDLSIITNATNSLPAELFDVALRVGVVESSGIIVSALGVRFVMGLVPFIRLGR